MTVAVLSVYLFGMLFVLKGIEMLISRIDERNAEADSHHYFWKLWFSISRWTAIWSCLCALVYMVGIERPNQVVDYLIVIVCSLAYAALSGGVLGFLPALAAAAHTDDGEASMIKASALVFLMQWVFLVLISWFLMR